MVEQKSAKSEDGKGVPAAGEQKTAETRAIDTRLFPGGVTDGAKRPVGVAAIDKADVPLAEVEVGGTKSTS
ncbi:MAG TPA: hypothetical protein VKH34_07950 [Vicinamibacterales bacterium]|nr:hypothetical protein [Vicinamibacterales bacterium]